METNRTFSEWIASTRPAAIAQIKGGADFPDLEGLVYFYPAGTGLLVAAEIQNLPFSQDGRYGPFYGFHLHEGGSCVRGGSGEDAFPRAGKHYDPNGAPHPFHAGDFPVLLGNAGYAYMTFYTARLDLARVTGKTVIVHQHADDFRSQPSGDSGEMLACGVVERVQGLSAVSACDSAEKHPAFGRVFF